MGSPLFGLCLPLGILRERSIHPEQPRIFLNFSYSYKHSKAVCASDDMYTKDSFNLLLKEKCNISST